MKVGRGHVCNINPSRLKRSTSCGHLAMSLSGHVRCTSRLPDSLALTVFWLCFLLSYFPLTLTLLMLSPLGCSCPSLCSTCCSEGTEANSGEKIEGQESKGWFNCLIFYVITSFAIMLSSFMCLYDSTCQYDVCAEAVSWCDI